MPTHDQKNNSVDRRSFLAASAVGAVAASSTATIANAAGVPVANAKNLLKAGTSLGQGWTITNVQQMEAGAIRVVAGLDGSDRVANIAICRKEAGAGALASTNAVDLFLMNNGQDGAVRTPADEVAAVKRLASLLHGAEESLPGASHLMGRQERQSNHDPIDHLNPLEPVAG